MILTTKGEDQKLGGKYTAILWIFFKFKRKLTSSKSAKPAIRIAAVAQASPLQSLKAATSAAWKLRMS